MARGVPKYPLPPKVDRARELRREAPVPERLLWGMLRGRRLDGHKFRRQHPVGPFIADFYCAEAQLVVELDGATHAGRAEADAERTAYMESLGVAVYRVTNDELLEAPEAVAETVRQAVERRLDELNSDR